MDNYLYQFMFMHLLFLLSLFLVLLAGSLSSLQPLCHEDERSALLQFKDSFIINKSASYDPSAYPKVASWTLEGEHSDCCLWDGVECNEDTGHVIGLDLSSSYLYGSINSSNSQLFHLLQLQRLNLADNDFNLSQIPFGVGHLSRLAYLNLSFSVFSGQIPSELSHLSNLSSLDLSRNPDLYTESDLRNLVQNLTSLEELLLSRVNISSAIPESLANLSSLTTLDLEYCQLHGEFPTRIFQLPNLRDLRIGGNQNLTGHLPEFHSDNPLKVLSIKRTSFFGKLPASVGSIPPSLSNLTQLTHLDLSMNNLTGHIPSSLLANLTQLTVLDLSINKLSGMLELDMFLKIKSLTYLDLSSNNLTLLTNANSNDTLPQFHTLALRSCNLRKFPDFLHNQNKLRWLDLQDNNLQGLIPKWLYNISTETLQEIILSENSLIGFEQSPVVLPWSNIESLAIENNMLQGSLPIPPPSTKIYRVQRNLIREMSPLICNLSSLEVLDLSYNNLTGKLHPCIGNFSSLSILQLQRNNFYGTIPKTWAKGSNLWMIDLSENQLQGQLPRSMANCLMLLYLNVSSNQLNGTFPLWLVCNMSSLYILDLSYNKLSGMLHPCLGNFSSPLSVLQLRSNDFHGTIPKTWAEGSNLRMIDLSENKLQGQLPRSMANCLMLEYLNVSNNQLNGTFPFWLVCNLSSLHVLDLSYNNLSGMLHPCLGNFSSPLSVLQLQSNNFHGTIPKTWAKGSNLRIIDLSENQFQGQLPRSMANCIMLEYLHVGNNQINDTFPFWLGTLSWLKVLVLRSNGFHGAIKSPTINYTFPELHIIDLSQNSLSGNLPIEYFLQWNAMKVVGTNQLKYMEVNSTRGGLGGSGQFVLIDRGVKYSRGGGWGGSIQCTITITNKGIKLKYEKIPYAFRVIDFSSNKFEGEIPDLVGSLKGLHSLNLSNNSFTGYIPPTLGNLTHIESMDLSQNKLFGEIPPQLRQLFSLEYFNVSNNNLTGPIPHGNQFDTFQNSSFEGNSGLCGSPLSKKCGDFKYTPTQPPFEENQSSEPPFEFGWKVVAVGYGCGFVIGLVIGKIVITRKYDWFVKIFGRM